MAAAMVGVVRVGVAMVGVHREVAPLVEVPREEERRVGRGPVQVRSQRVNGGVCVRGFERTA